MSRGGLLGVAYETGAPVRHSVGGVTFGRTSRHENARANRVPAGVGVGCRRIARPVSPSAWNRFRQRNRFRVWRTLRHAVPPALLRQSHTAQHVRVSAHHVRAGGLARRALRKAGVRGSILDKTGGGTRGRRRLEDGKSTKKKSPSRVPPHTGLRGVPVRRSFALSASRCAHDNYKQSVNKASRYFRRQKRRRRAGADHSGGRRVLGAAGEGKVRVAFPKSRHTVCPYSYQKGALPLP